MARPEIDEKGWLVLGLRPTVENGERGDSTEAWIADSQSRSVLRAPQRRCSEREGGNAACPGAHRRRSSQSDENAAVAIDEHGDWSRKRPSRPPEAGSGHWSAGRSAWRNAALGDRGRDRHRAAPGPETGRLGRGGGGRTAQALGEGEGALDGQRPQENDRLLDATFTALAALRNERLARVHPEDGLEGRVEVLRLLTERREDLVAERTRALNRLHVLLRDPLSDGVAKKGLSAEAAAKVLRRARPNHAAGRTRKRLASELARDVRTLDRKIASLEQRIREEVGASGTTLTEVFGVGPILAAKIVGIVGDVSRFPSKKAHFASSGQALLPSKPLAERLSGTGSRCRATGASTPS
jgi:hypothetical protein